MKPRSRHGTYCRVYLCVAEAWDLKREVSGEVSRLDKIVDVMLLLLERGWICEEGGE